MINGNITLPSSMDLAGVNWQDHFQCYKQLPVLEKYYNKHNSSIWQVIIDNPEWAHELARLVPRDFSHHEVSIIKIEPGNTVPYHADKHYILQQNHGPGDTWRYLIFLEDWKMGHYFEVHNKPVVEWKAGDWIKFHRTDWHLAGNMGLEPFFSAQVTVK